MPKDAKSYAPRIPPDTWEQYRHRIKALFVDQNKTLSKVAAIMRTYGLHASQAQYERQLKSWDIRKNRTRDEWRLVHRKVEERRRQAKDSAVLINGIEQPKERLEREFARSDHRNHGGLDQSLPEDIQILSPPPSPLTNENLPDHSNSKDGISSMARLEIKLTVQQLQAYFAKPRARAWLWIMDSPASGRSTLTKYLQRSGSRFVHSIERPLVRYQRDPTQDDGPMLDAGSRSPSPSPLRPWSIPTWESVGVTSEEWVSRGWDMFYGTWR